MARTDSMTRREVAEMLDLHQDSVSRRLADGLASAVLQWGGRGKEMAFSRTAVLRWWRASTCARDGGRPCLPCRRVLEDTVAVAEHLLETRHGYGGCQECRTDWKVCQPCA